MKKLFVAACFCLFLLSPSALQAQIGVGGQLSFADDVDAGIGARGTYALQTTVPLEAIASFDYFFPGEGLTYWEFNSNLVYLVKLQNSPVVPYAGAGLNIAHASVSVDILGTETSASDTQVGVNLLGGAKFDLGPVTPFGELRFELNGGEQFVISAGALIPVGPGR